MDSLLWCGSICLSICSTSTTITYREWAILSTKPAFHSATRTTMAVAALDTLVAAGPFQFGADFGNLVVARLHEAGGNAVMALREIKRRPYD
jgi:hypothetical protein